MTLEKNQYVLIHKPTGWLSIWAVIWGQDKEPLPSFSNIFCLLHYLLELWASIYSMTFEWVIFVVLRTESPFVTFLGSTESFQDQGLKPIWVTRSTWLSTIRFRIEKDPKKPPFTGTAYFREEASMKMGQTWSQDVRFHLTSPTLTSSNLGKQEHSGKIL